MGNVTQNDRAEAVEFVEGSILTAQETGKNGEERCLRDLLVVLNAGIAALETLAAAEKRANEEATAASWFAEQNEIEQEKRRASEAERDAAQKALASCRKALEFIRTCAHYPIWVFRAQHWGLHERPDGYVQPHDVFCGLLSAAAQVPAEHLTGAPEGARVVEGEPLRAISYSDLGDRPGEMAARQLAAESMSEAGAAARRALERMDQTPTEKLMGGAEATGPVAPEGTEGSGQ